MIVVCLISVFLLLSSFTSAEDGSSGRRNHVGTETCVTKSVLDWFRNSLIDELNNILPTGRSSGYVEGRKKKKGKLNKYVLPLLIGSLLIKSILLPIALKALAVLSGKAVILSLMSLVLAAIVGLKKVASSGDKSVDVVTVPLSKYRRKDMLYDWDEIETDEPYGYYRDRRLKNEKND